MYSDVYKVKILYSFRSHVQVLLLSFVGAWLLCAQYIEKADPDRPPGRTEEKSSKYYFMIYVDGRHDTLLDVLRLCALESGQPLAGSQLEAAPK